jgi:hypothetical protein
MFSKCSKNISVNNITCNIFNITYLHIATQCNFINKCFYLPWSKQGLELMVILSLDTRHTTLSGGNNLM